MAVGSKGCLLLAALAPAGLAAAAGTDHGSLSNGFAAVTFDTTNVQLDAFYPHLYAALDANTTTASLVQGAYFGVRGGGTQVWLYQQPVTSASYVGQGTVFEVVQAAPGGLTAETYVYAPDDFAGAVGFLVLHVINGSAAAVSDNGAFAFISPTVGSGSPAIGAETVAYEADGGAFELSGATGTLLAQALPAPADYAQSPTDVAGTVSAGASLPDTGGPSTQDDAAAGFQWAIPTLAPGQDAWVGVALASLSGDPSTWLEQLGTYVEPGPQALVAAQEQRDAAALASAQLPAGLSSTETQVARQQLSVLAMAQVREPNADGGTPYGALVASLPPGEWNIAWVRDSTYAIVALARAGRVQQAKDALAFLLQAQVGAYEAEVGVPYGVSVCRHYGDGQEWSDENQDGPNIELDGFGLTLWATAEVIRAGGAPSVAALSPFVARLELVAQSIAALVDDTGLLSPDSSIWEVHWDGQQKHFTYTDAAAVAGLEVADEVAAQLGLPDAGFAAVARGIAQSMQAKLVDPVGAIPGTLEAAQGSGDDRDAAALEAYNLAGLDPTVTIAAVETGLLVASGLGYRRDDQGSTYDDSEWAFIDLRLATADFGMGFSAAGEILLDRVGNAALGAYGLIPELYDPDSGAYAGAVPMVGFGAAAYLLTLEARAAGPVAPIDWSADAGAPGMSVDAGVARDAGVAPDAGPPLSQADAGAAPPSPSGCGCGPVGGVDWGWLLLIGSCLAARSRPGRRSGRTSRR